MNFVDKKKEILRRRLTNPNQQAESVHPILDPFFLLLVTIPEQNIRDIQTTLKFEIKIKVSDNHYSVNPTLIID